MMSPALISKTLAYKVPGVIVCTVLDPAANTACPPERSLPLQTRQSSGAHHPGRAAGFAGHDSFTRHGSLVQVSIQETLLERVRRYLSLLGEVNVKAEVPAVGQEL